MSTRSSIKYSRPEGGPGYHLWADCFDDPATDPVYLELFGVDAELSTDGRLQVAIPRQMARELGLLPHASGVAVPGDQTKRGADPDRSGSPG